MNVEIGTEDAQFPTNGIHKWVFRCSAPLKLASRVNFLFSMCVVSHNGILRIFWHKTALSDAARIFSFFLILLFNI